MRALCHAFAIAGLLTAVGFGVSPSPARAGSPIDLPQATVAPENGFWWNPADPGAGYTLDTQVDNPFSGSGNRHLFLAAYLYQSDGSPVWLVASGIMVGNSFTGPLTWYRGGRTLTGAGSGAGYAGSPGNITLTFSSNTSASLVLPSGETVPLQRFKSY